MSKNPTQRPYLGLGPVLWCDVNMALNRDMECSFLLSCAGRVRGVCGDCGILRFEGFHHDISEQYSSVFDRENASDGRPNMPDVSGE